MKSRIPFAAGMLVIVTTFCFLLLAIYWLVWPYKVVQINHMPIEVSTKVVRWGESIDYNVDLCKFKDGPCTMSHQLINDRIILLPETVSNVPVGCKVYTVSINIPEYSPSGTYYILGMASYKVNPLRTITCKFSTESFTIIGHEETR